MSVMFTLCICYTERKEKQHLNIMLDEEKENNAKELQKLRASLDEQQKELRKLELQLDEERANHDAERNATTQKMEKMQVELQKAQELVPYTHI